MKKLLLVAGTLVFAVTLIFLSACGGAAPAPTPRPTVAATSTPARASTPAPTAAPAATPRPYSTPAVTATPPRGVPTSTPAPTGAWATAPPSKGGTPAATATPGATPNYSYRATPIPAPIPYPTGAAQPQQGFPSTDSGTIGLAAGGAKDVGNFRENIRNNYLPLPTDVTYEGLFYDYFFDTGAMEPTDKLFAPSYSFAVTRDPISQKTDYYLAVGLNSGMKESDFQRKKLNLVIVLDNSGSMSANFNQYYYDRLGRRVDAFEEEGTSALRKMDSAISSVTSILDQLGDGDRVGVVTFNSNAALIKALGQVSSTNMDLLKNKVEGIIAGGSTNLMAGISMATDQFRGLYETDAYEYENRIIVLTDAEPNTGDTSASGFYGALGRNAESRIYTTVIGVGVDFNSQLVERITKIKGANYYSVHSPREFRERVQDEFDYMVTPLVFDLELNFSSPGWRIEKVFGSPEAAQATGQLMKINTLFAAKSEGGENRGGLVMLKLRKTSSVLDEKVYLDVTYEDRNGRLDGSQAVISLESQQPEYFPNSGIRKGVLLTRYAVLLQNWMIDERQHAAYSRPWDPGIGEDTGIVIPNLGLVSQWERQSLPLMVSAPYVRMFRTFQRYFADEMAAIGDDTLDQELAILSTLSR